jgi:ketosteroid isomerase-like protein
MLKPWFSSLHMRKWPPFNGGMMKNIMSVLGLVFCLVFCATAQKSTKPVAAGTVDKAYLQKIWDGWATLDASNQRQYYAQGPHVFFDDEPLKYNSWGEYESTVSKELADYSAAKFTVNDDAQIHRVGDNYWITSTVASDMTHKSGKHEMATLRWTAIFEKQGGKWLIVHEHVSVPAQ